MACTIALSMTACGGKSDPTPAPAATPAPKDTLVWDFMATDMEGSYLEFIGLDFSAVDETKGATITLTATEGGEYMATVE